MVRSLPRLLALSAAVLVLARSAPAQNYAGTGFTYQGQLLSAGAPGNGSYDMRFRLLDGPGGGATQLGPTICSENVQVSGGQFTVPLDFGRQFSNTWLWLEISVRADSAAGNCATGVYTTLTPRQELKPAPYAMGLSLPVSEFVSDPGAALALVNFGGDCVSATSGATGRSGVYGVSTTSDGYAIFGRNTQSTDVGVLGGGDFGVYGEDQSTAGAGGWFLNTNAAGRGLVGQTNAATGSTFGVVGMTASLRGTAVYGTDSQNVARGSLGARYPGAGGSNESPLGVYGVLGNPSNWYAPGGAGVFGDSSTGPGVMGYSSNDGTVTYNPIGVWGFAAANSGVTYGVYGQARSPTGVGVYGAGDSNTGQNYGVEGVTSSDTGRGVFGLCGSATGLNYGVYGQTNSPAGYGGYFLGRGYFSDNVGLGVLQPSVPLQVAGGSDLSLGGGGNIVVGQVGSANIVMDNNEIQSRNNGAAASLFINANGGSVGIGTGNAQGFQLAVSGTAAKTGGGSWATLSDERVKRNIRPLTGALDKLLRLRGVTFEYIDPASINELPGLHTGMLAQEVEKIAPEWVATGPTGLKSVAFSGFEALTVEALRESTQAQDRTRAQVEELERENQSLRKRLADLETAVAAMRASPGAKQ
jgi:Chaperone of endosialidase